MGRQSTFQDNDFVPPDVRRRIRARLLTWYDRNKRDLPWRRRSGDPYAQWVAEIMLQQTRVETVIDYYLRFLKRFPSVSSLARANHQTVLKHWEGLGYYRRALHMHEAAKSIASNGKTMPPSAAELRKLRGIGEYTSAAIASIAYNEPAAAVDGNVARVIARLFAINDDILSTRGKFRIQQIADRLLPPKRPGDFNQAWMDFGSMICTPQSPNCTSCPLKASCRANELGLVGDLPVRGANKKKEIPTVSLVVGVFTNGDRALVRRRPTGGLWSGLWEFPNDECRNELDDEAQVQELAESLGIQCTSNISSLGVLCHQLTHRLMQFRVFLVQDCKVIDRIVATDDNTNGKKKKWLLTGELSALPFSTAQRKILNLAMPHLLKKEPIPQTQPRTRSIAVRSVRVGHNRN